MSDDSRALLAALEALIVPFLESLYTTFGYAGVVVAMAIESAAIPVPSEIILPFAGWMVSRGLPEPLTGTAWSYWGAVAAGVIGNTLGSLLSYALGRSGGRPLLERYGTYVLIGRHDLDLADRWFARWGEATVLFSRMLPIVRTFISVPAGVARMPLWRFTVFSLIGAVPWVMLLVWGGFVLGESWPRIKDALRGLDYLVAAAILLLVGLFVWRHVRR
jgi:membrane protein DedA with SNARE-associated domain